MFKTLYIISFIWNRSNWGIHSNTHIYPKPEVNFSVENSRKWIVGLDFERHFYYIIPIQSCG